MFGFKSKRQSTNSLAETNNKVSNIKQDDNIYQAGTRYGVKPEYFDYEKIELNKFLTNDREYRDYLKTDNQFCNKSMGWERKRTCCHKKRYYKDLAAFDDINTAISNGIDSNVYLSLSGARKSYLEDEWNHSKQEMEQRKLQQFYNENPHHLETDFRGLYPEDYDFITNDLQKQAFHLSEETKRLLIDQKTKLLDIDSLSDMHINSNVVRNFDTKFAHQCRDKYFDDIKDYKRHVTRVTPEFLMERSYARTLDNVNNLANQVNDNAFANEYNFNEIKKTEKFIESQGRLKNDVPSVFEVMAQEKAKEEVIDLDKLTPYNIVKPNIRVRKSEKRNISL